MNVRRGVPVAASGRGHDRRRPATATPSSASRRERRSELGLAGESEQEPEGGDPGGDPDHRGDDPGPGRAERVTSVCPHPDQPEEDEAGCAEPEPPRRDDAEDGPEGEGDHHDPDDQCRLVVGAEQLDGEVLQRAGEAVDELGADRRHQRWALTGQAAHQFADAEGDAGGDGAGDSGRDAAGTGLEGSGHGHQACRAIVTDAARRAQRSRNSRSRRWAGAGDRSYSRHHAVIHRRRIDPSA